MEISISLDPAVNKDLENYLKEMNASILPFGEGKLSYHVDVMDGKLVERAAINSDEYAFITDTALLPADVHLMIKNPDERINEFLKVPQSSCYGKTVRSITFHIEALSKFHAIRLISMIKKAEFKAGIAIDLDTDIGVDDYKSVIEKCDVIIVMSVKAGKSGQTFNMDGLKKVAAIKKINPGCRVILDGGISASNIGLVKYAGVDTAVIGSYVYNSENRKETVKNLVRLVKA